MGESVGKHSLRIDTNNTNNTTSSWHQQAQPTTQRGPTCQCDTLR